MQDERSDDFEAALARWLKALNTFGDPDVVDAAVDPDVRIERYGFASQKGQLVEEIVGREDVTRWCALSPRSAVFDLPDSVRVVDSPDGPKGEVAFRVVVPDLTNVGRWECRLAPDGRLSWLAHHPGEIDDAVEEVAFLRGDDRWGPHECELDDGHGHGVVIEGKHHHDHDA